MTIAQALRGLITKAGGEPSASEDIAELIQEFTAVYSAGGASLAPGSVTSDALANDAVTSEKLAANAVTTEKIAADAVTAEKIADGVIPAG